MFSHFNVYGSQASACSSSSTPEMLSPGQANGTDSKQNHYFCPDACCQDGCSCCGWGALKSNESTLEAGNKQLNRQQSLLDENSSGNVQEFPYLDDETGLVSGDKEQGEDDELTVPDTEDGTDEYEIVLDEANPADSSRRSIGSALFGMFMRNRGQDGVADPEELRSAQRPTLDYGRKPKRSNVAIVETADSVEAQRADGEIVMSDSAGRDTRVVVIDKPKSKRRLFILIAVLCFALACFLAALLLGFLNNKARSSLRGEKINVQHEVTAPPQYINNTIVVKSDQKTLLTGCFDYTNGPVVCLIDENPSDGLCKVTVDGTTCSSCSVCNIATGSVRADCAGLQGSGDVPINDSCISTEEVFANTLLAAFVLGANVSGIWVNLPTNAPSAAPPATPAPVTPNFTTGCFDYSQALNQGSSVCLTDQNPTDGVCMLTVNGAVCQSCNVCNSGAWTATLKGDLYLVRSMYIASVGSLYPVGTTA